MKKNWYIAIIVNNDERRTAERIAEQHEVYLPVQEYISIWKDGRRKVRQRLLLRGKLLVRCTERERRALFQFPTITRFMIDIASMPDEQGRKSIAIVPDEQVQMMKFLLGQQDSEVTIDNIDLQNGERVRVARGVLKGLEGIVTDWSNNTTKVHVQIAHLGCAAVEVNINDVERIS